MLRVGVLLLLMMPVWAAAQPSLAAGFTHLAPGARVVLMPTDIELYEVSGGGVLEPRADWTQSAAEHVSALLRTRGIGEGLTGEPDPAIAKIMHLHRAVSSAVVIHHYGHLRLPTKDGRLDWSLGPDAAPLRSRTGADYALFTWIRDSYASPARKAAMAVSALVGLGVAGGAQVAYASLVDLQTGRIVWFNRVSRLRGDLRSADAAQESVEALLEGFPG